EVASLPDAERKLASPRWRASGEACREIAGLPRHISQHPGGMVISSRPLIELVPVQPCAMAGRQMCQWDKDSCGDAGFLKIDLLGLGMLSAVEDCVEQTARRRGETVGLCRTPPRDPALADTIYDKVVGFSGFGFPKSHAAAFGLLAYQSAWLRHHYPSEFLCALLNEQPMGFYPPASLVRDAQRRAVDVAPPDVNLSGATCEIQDGRVRIGLEYVTSVGEDDSKAI